MASAVGNVAAMTSSEKWRREIKSWRAYGARKYREISRKTAEEIK